MTEKLGPTCIAKETREKLMTMRDDWWGSHIYRAHSLVGPSGSYSTSGPQYCWTRVYFSTTVRVIKYDLYLFHIYFNLFEFWALDTEIKFKHLSSFRFFLLQFFFLLCMNSMRLCRGLECQEWLLRFWKGRSEPRGNDNTVEMLWQEP